MYTLPRRRRDFVRLISRVHSRENYGSRSCVIATPLHRELTYERRTIRVRVIRRPSKTILQVCGVLTVPCAAERKGREG